MTAHDDSEQSVDRQAGAENTGRTASWEHIGITAEMIRVGVAKWEEWQISDNPYPETLVRRIYRAMRSLEPDHSS